MGLNVGPQQWWLDRYRLVQRSLRFNSSDSAYLGPVTRTGNKTTWTLSFWIKRCKTGRVDDLFGHISGGFGQTQHRLSIFDEKLYFVHRESASNTTELKTTAVFRDPSAWYHVAVVWDTNNGTASNRARIYVNGKRVTAFDIETYPSSGKIGYINDSTYPIGIGAHPTNASSYLDAYLADMWFVDGYAATETNGTLDEFGEFDANNIWQPKAYTGSASGTSFHLPFSDNSTSAALGTDTSGNGNDWTVNNISVAAGAGNDSLLDVPTNGTETDTGVGGEVRGNYCTWNPLSTISNTSNDGVPPQLRNGNLECHANSVASPDPLFVTGTIAFPTSGKWYYEAVCDVLDGGRPALGLISSDSASVLTIRGVAGLFWRPYIGIESNGNIAKISDTAVTAGDVFMILVDMDQNKAWVGWEGAFYGRSGASTAVSVSASDILNGTNPAYTLTAGKTYLPMSYHHDTSVMTSNFGQRSFTYTPPSGYKALCTANLPAPVVTNPSEYMDVKLYAGTSSIQTISGLEFSPDFVWIKARSFAYDHCLVDSVRGVSTSTTGTQLSSNNTNAEPSNINGHIGTLNSDGFTTAAGSSGSFPWAGVGQSGVTYAAWCWDAGDSTVTNTDGSITSQVRANPSAGFSIVTFNQTTSPETIGHGLGVAPQMIIVKDRDTGGTDWQVYHASIGATNKLLLNLTNSSSSSTIFDNTAPTGTVFSLGATFGLTVAYCFAPVEGYSAFGSYTGNGNADGPFVFTNHRPRWIMIKNTTSGSTNNWVIYDAARNTYNETNLQLWPNSSNGGNTYEATSSNVPIDILSNGFKIRSTGGDVNTNTNVYIYATFASNPFSISRAR